MKKNKSTRKYPITFCAAFDKETFEKAISLAVKMKTSRSAMMRFLVTSAYNAQLGEREKLLLENAAR